MPMQTFDFAAPSFRSDPYPLWSALRSQGPVHRDASGAWVVVSHHEAKRWLQDPRVGKDLRHLAGDAGEQDREALSGIEYYVEKWIECRLPEVHRKWRRLVIPGFTHKALASQRQSLRQVAAMLLADVPEGEPFELVHRFARPFPVVAISRAFGLSSERDLHEIASWSRAIGLILEPGATEQVQQAGELALERMGRYLWDEMAARRRTPQPDFLTHTLEEGAGLLTEAQLTATILLLFLSGHETTTSLICNGVLGLAGAPEQVELLRRSPELMSGAVDEALRYDGPACVVIRTTYESVSVADVTIPAGQLLLFALGAANRDPAEFEEPDRFLLDRPNQHLAFGVGNHLCVGSGLARLEASVAFDALLSRFPQPMVDETTVRWGDALYLRGPEHLVMT